ncbi:protein FAR-RED ELONGATED HYPOCOTYL 3-like [Juglans microcarpa x Juglans regia]|uniref:protein FAR-RED ELONGATED HYPOCOTYL 3-like n=1 Tax=Juglans microcarpa x Juglans regia TaxID=2249226 RepID=UPI001B7EF566|nr:protein FAR-RED ELONGATED HYPOCOTYL 3-like [Juglans microcarpa x Juglans regia]
MDILSYTFGGNNWISEPLQELPIPFYDGFSNYMHGCHPPMPHVWLPLFVPCRDANSSTWTTQVESLSTSTILDTVESKDDDESGTQMMNLKEFFYQFNNALRKKIENENGVNFQSFNFRIPVVTVSPFEKIFQELYTNSKFREVQQEVMGIVGCLPILQQNNGVIATYYVEDKIHVDDFIKEVTHFVYFNEAECEVKCPCRLFEMRGILCRHVFGTLKINRVRMLSEKYILDRWRKDIKRKYTLISSSYDIADAKPDMSRYSCIMKICGDIASNAASHDEHHEDMIDKLHAMNKVNADHISEESFHNGESVQTQDEKGYAKGKT